MGGWEHRCCFDGGRQVEDAADGEGRFRVVVSIQWNGHGGGGKMLRWWTFDVVDTSDLVRCESRGEIVKGGSRCWGRSGTVQALHAVWATATRS